MQPQSEIALRLPFIMRGVIDVEKTLIMCRSMTQAQRAQRLLERNGIISSFVKAPLHLTKSGCGYALILRRHSRDAIQILRDAGLLNGKIYDLVGESWEERRNDLS